MGIDLATLDVAKEVVQLVEAALAATVVVRGLVADVLLLATAHGLVLRIPGEPHGAGMVGRAGRLVVIATLSVGVRLSIGTRISSTNLPGVIKVGRIS